MALRALGDIEMIRKRPGMFIGDVQTPDHLAEEVLDNAIDEISNGFATEINIFNNLEDGSFWVSDNGRGIPITMMKLPDGTEDESINVLCTRLFSGSKFDTDDYSKLIGMHGVGLIAVNALSEWFVVKTRDRVNKRKVITYTFKDAELISSETEYNSESYSTVVGFKPNKQHFETLEFNNRYFVERLISVQSIFDLHGFTFNDKELPKMDFETYVKQHLCLDDDSQLFSLSYSSPHNKNHIKIYATYVEKDDFITIGNVNLRTCDGKFITSFYTELKKSINEKIDKSFSKINDREYLNGLRCFIMVSIPEPKFDSQTKVRMVLDIKKILIDPLKSQIDWFVEQIIDTIESNLERKLHQKIMNGSSKSSRSNKRVSIGNKLKDCQKIPGDVLYIVEGDSAGGTIKQIRNSQTEAIYPLKGKVLNVESSTLDKIKNNKEIKDLLEALGPINNRRYKSIKILGDADSVGAETPILYLDKDKNIKWNFIKDIIDSDIDYVISLNSSTKNMEFQKVLRVIKHDYSKKEIFRIKSIMGHYIDCTEDHVIYTFNIINNEIKEKSPSQINTDIEYLIAPKEFPTVNNEIILDITNNIIENDLRSTVYIELPIESYENDIDEDLVRIDLKDRVKYDSKFTRTAVSKFLNINTSTLKMYDTGRDNTSAPLKLVKQLRSLVNLNLKNTLINIKLTKDSIKYINYGKIYHHKSREIKTKFTLTESLAYLVGFYIGDGCRGSSKNNPFEIHFSYGTDKDCETRLINACKEIGFNNFVIDKTTKTCFNLKVKSIELSSILDHFGLTQEIKSWTKFVPKQFFSCSENIRRSLLMGIFHSDGCFIERKKESGKCGYKLNHASTSKNLQIDLSILLRQFGIIPVLQSKEPTIAGLNQKSQQIIGRKKIYMTSVNRFNDLQKLIEICESFPEIEINENINGINFQTINDSTIIIPIRSIEKIDYNYDCVYDLEVENNNNFSTGTIGAIYHNSDGKHIAVLVLLVLQKFAADYIKSGKVSVIIPPLYGATKGNKYYPIYDYSTVDQFRNNGFKINRFKGLGEMNPSQLNTCIRSGFEYQVKWPDNDKQLNNLVSIITNTELKRAIMNAEGVKMDIILTEVNKQIKQKQKLI